MSYRETVHTAKWLTAKWVAAKWFTAKCRTTNKTKKLTSKLSFTRTNAVLEHGCRQVCAVFILLPQQNFRYTSKIRTLLRFPLGDIVIKTIRKRVCRRRRKMKQPRKKRIIIDIQNKTRKKLASVKNDNRTNKYKNKKQETHKNQITANRKTL